MSRHPFFDGRRVVPLAPLTTATYAVAYLFWYGSVDGGRCGVGVIELLGFTLVLVSTWLLNPAMASWEATGTTALKRCATVTQLGVIAVASAMPIAVAVAVIRLPASIVPRSGRYDFGELGISVWLPVVTNLMVLAAIVSIAIALTGRLAGTIIALAAYPALFWLGSSANASSPYTAFCSTDTKPPTWFAAGVAGATVASVLIATGGTTVLSRRLDPRHAG